MNCNSCAALIEAKLESRPGIISSKASFDSQKVSIAYDETRITEQELMDIVKSAGDFKFEKIEDAPPVSTSQNAPAFINTAPIITENQKNFKAINAVSSIAILSIALNIILIMALSTK